MTQRHRTAGAYPRPPIPSDEPERLETLRRYEILDTPSEQAFDDLTLLAAQICQTPVALVTLINRDRQWFKSRVGLDITETPRDLAFCAHAIAAHQTMIVPDTLKDHRFAQHPFVVGDPKIRFYAGAPLQADQGHCLGTVCVIDRVPREFSDSQRAALEALSRQAMAQIELRRQVAEVKRLAGQLPYCSMCGKLRTDLGDICPDCLTAA